jgi:hypothetical protein
MVGWPRERRECVCCLVHTHQRVLEELTSEHLLAIPGGSLMRTALVATVPCLPSQDVQRLLDIAARADVDEGIRQGLKGAKEGKVRPAREFFREFEARHGLPR